MTQNENGYVSYLNMLTDVISGAERLRHVCKKLGMDDHAQSLDSVKERLQNHVFRVGILGEFNRGKSTVINALLGQEIVPSDILPCTATLNRVVWDARPHAKIKFKTDNADSMPAERDLPVEDLAAYITKLTPESADQANEVEEAVVYYPCKFCQNGVEIIDTPGLNDDERMDKVSESVIPTLDAIIMVVVPGHPFGLSEANFVRNKILTSDLSRLIFVVNKIDTVRERDRSRCINGIRNKIRDTVLEKTADMYGKDSEEYASAESKLDGIHIYPLSAADALDAKLEGDMDLLEKSFMPEFESALTKMLTQERGLLELVPSVSAVMSKLKEADENIVMRNNAMALDAAEFDRMYEEAVARINESREEKKRKVKEIKGLSASICQELQPEVLDAYNYLQQTVETFIEGYSITDNDFADDAAAAMFSKKASTAINGIFERCMEESTEKMLVKIQNRVKQEIEDIEVYNKKISANVQEIRGLISGPTIQKEASEKIDKVDMAAMAVETVTNFTNIVPGLGGAISGFKDHGVLGGLVGFGTGYIATHAVAYGACQVAMATLGAAASTAVVPILVIAGVVGAFGGKKITNALFNTFKKPSSTNTTRKLSESDILRIRKSFVEEANKNVNNLRVERVLEKWLKDVTDDTFTKLSEKLDAETEAALQGLQENLTKVQVDLGKNKVHRDAVQKDLEEMHQALMEIANLIAPVKKRLDEAFQANS